MLSAKQVFWDQVLSVLFLSLFSRPVTPSRGVCCSPFGFWTKCRAESSACDGVTVAYIFCLNYRPLPTTSPDKPTGWCVLSLHRATSQGLLGRTPGAHSTAGHAASNLWPQPQGTGQENGPSHGLCPWAWGTQVTTPTESSQMVCHHLPSLQPVNLPQGRTHKGCTLELHSLWIYYLLPRTLLDKF